MEATLTACPQCVVYNEQLNNNVDEIKVLQEHIIKLTYKLQDESRIKEEVQDHLNEKLMRLNDYAIKLRNLEEQLQSATDCRPIDELPHAEVDGIIGRDLENIHTQLIEKDMKIMELNDTIFEKERHIIELQEMCREQRELVHAKTKAFHIIQQKLLDLNTRTTREDSTETEAAYIFESTFIPLSSVQQLHKERQHQPDSFSPGHAVVQFKMGSSGSPPPVDPSEECSSTTQSNGKIQDGFDGDDGDNASTLYKKKQRKKVTFDLQPRKEFKNDNGQKEGDIMQTIIDVTTENDQLRQTIQEMEKCATESQNHLGQLQTQFDEIRRDGRNQILKVRASTQRRIRDLEDKITTMNTEHVDKIEHLNASIETLRADREWILEENARLLKLLSSYKEKLTDTSEALDTRQEESKKLRSKLDDDRALIVQLVNDLEEAQQTANILLEQKVSVLDDVERLKEALEAQDQYIELLEKDTMIYEEHVGLLRDSLGASKAERRALIRSKAYEAKLKALEQEKEQMNRRNNDEKLHKKALNLKISSLEAEKVVLMNRNNELESRLIQLGKNISPAPIIACSTATVTSDAVEAIPNLKSSENAFKPVHTQERADERQIATEVLQCSVLENLANARGYYEEKLINNMRIELDAVRKECSLVQEKIIQMGCVNFELENQLKDAEEKLKNAEIRVQQAEEQAKKARQNCAQQKKYRESLQSEFLAKLNIAEKEINDLKEELDLKNELLKGRTVENNKRNEELKQWRFAIDEIEAVHMQIQMLEKQLNNEKAAMELKWAEVRTILLERKGDMSRKTSAAESVIDGEQNTVDQFSQMMDTVDDLENAFNEQAKQLEFDKTERRKFKAVIRQLQVDKKALLASFAMKNNDGEQQHMIQYETQLIGLQRQRDFMDHEMTLLCSLNNSKDVLIQTLQAKLEDTYSEKSELSHLRCEIDRNEDRYDPIEHLQTHIEIMDLEKSGVLNLLAKRSIGLQEEQMHAQRGQMGFNQLQLQLKFSQLQQAQQQIEVIESEKDLSMSEESIDGAVDKNIIKEMKAQIERCTATLQQKNTELQKVLNENETLKIKCTESTAALDLLSNELERRSQEKDDIIEMLQSQHTYLTQTILLKEKNEKQLAILPTVSQNMDVDIESKCAMQNASTVMEKVVQYCETQTMTDFHFSETAEARQEQSSEYLNESNQMHDNTTDEIRQLMILNAELETAVEVLKGEIWTLNEQLKESLIDREDLSEKLCEISQRHEEEIERARERERDLEEQKDMAERSQRQAALAENESNRRLVEWQEKSAQMENSRIELENSYTKLSEYYQQLQQAYNLLYARLNALKTDNNTQTIMDSNTFKISEEIRKEVEYLTNELAQQKRELENRTVELQFIRDLLREHLHIILKSVKDLREMNLKLFKDFVNDNMQTVQAQLQENLKEARSYIDKVIVKWLEKKELKNTEIATAVQQLINGALTEDISQTPNLLLSVIVDAVSEKFSEKESENATLKNDLWDQKNDKAAFKMEMQQSVSGREEELELKIKKLEDLLQVTQFSLAEHVIKCQQLQAKLDVLDLATDQSNSAAAKSGSIGSDLWKCSTPCTICRELRQTKQSSPTLQLQLAILAARLTTKIADNDALFRCNAELAQTNLRLQNEIDKLMEQMAKYIKSSDNIGISATNQQSAFEQRHVPKQPSNQLSKQKVVYREDKEQTVAKDFDAKSVNSSEFRVVSQQFSLNQQIIGYTTTDEVQMTSSRELGFQEQCRENLENKLNTAQKYSSELEEENESMKSNAEELEVSKVYCFELGNEKEQPEDGFTTRQHKDVIHQKLEVNRTNVGKTDFVRNLNQELEKLKMELQSTKIVYENEETCKLFQMKSTEGLKMQKEKLEEDKQKSKQSDWILDDTWKHFQTSLEEQLQNILQNDTIQGGKIQLLQELKVQLKQKEFKMQELEKENRSLNQQLNSQQQLIKELEKKFDVTKEYSMTLEVKNLNMKQEITDQKKKYEELIIEKSKLTKKVGNEMRKLHKEIMVLKQNNKNLTVELTKKQTCLDEEKAKIRAEIINAEWQLMDREIVLEDLVTKLKHTQEESVQMQSQPDDYNTEVSESRRKNEIDLGQDQQFVQAQKEITELKQKLDQMVKQNELLKNGEQKLTDALIISNKQLAKIKSKNERLKLEIANLKASLLKSEETAKGADHPEKSIMENVNMMVEMHSRATTSPTIMFGNSVTIGDCYPMQKMNGDKLRRRRGVSGLQSAEKI